MAIQIPYTDGIATPPGVSNVELQSNKGAPNGYAPLDANAKVPLANLPDQASLDAEVDGKISTHNSATTSVHGIANTANLIHSSENGANLNKIVTFTQDGGAVDSEIGPWGFGVEDQNGNYATIEPNGVNLNNGAKLQKGTTDAGLGGNKGIALKCSVDYELKWEAGRLYVLEQDGFTIRSVEHCTTEPSTTDNSTKGFVAGSRWVTNDGKVYICTYSTANNSGWSIFFSQGTFFNQGGSINTSAYPTGDASGGSINTSGGDGDARGGSINTSGDDGQSGGDIFTYGGGSINTSNNGGLIATNNDGGYINTQYDGGYVNTSNSGGYVNTSNSGGYIDTTRGGYIKTAGSINTDDGFIELGHLDRQAKIVSRSIDKTIETADCNGKMLVATTNGISSYDSAYSESEYGPSVRGQNEAQRTSNSGQMLILGGSGIHIYKTNISKFTLTFPTANSMAGDYYWIQRQKAYIQKTGLGDGCIQLRNGYFEVYDTQGGDVQFFGFIESPTGDLYRTVDYDGALPEVSVFTGATSFQSFIFYPPSYYSAETHELNLANGGTINTSFGGGSIYTFGTGSIEFGESGTRTTLNGSASGSNKTITLPNATGTISLEGHTHTIANVTGLQTALEGKQASGSYAPATHTHTKSQITDFSHTHAISDVTNLQTTLNAKRIYSYTPDYFAQNYNIPASPNTEREYALIVNTSLSSYTLNIPQSGNSVGDIITITNLPTSIASITVKEIPSNGATGIDPVLGDVKVGTTKSWVRINTGSSPGGWREKNPVSHNHGNINYDGTIGTTANLPLITTTSGVVTTGSFGTTANSFCQGNDSRLNLIPKTYAGYSFTATAASTADQWQATITIPANTLGANGYITGHIWASCSASSSAKRIRAYITNTNPSNAIPTVGAFTRFINLNTAPSTIATTTISIMRSFTIMNRNSVTSQIVQPSASGGLASTTSSDAFEELAYDTTQPLYIVIGLQKDATGDTLQLKAFNLSTVYAP